MSTDHKYDVTTWQDLADQILKLSPEQLGKRPFALPPAECSHRAGVPIVGLVETVHGTAIVTQEANK